MNSSPEEVSSTSEMYDASDETSEFSSDVECLSITRKNLNASQKSLQCDDMYLSPKEADPPAVPAEYDYLEIQRNVFGNVLIRKSVISGLETSSTATLEIGSIKKDGPQFGKKFVCSTELSQQEVIDPSEDKVCTSLGATSKARDIAASSYVVIEMSRDSTEDVTSVKMFVGSTESSKKEVIDPSEDKVSTSLGANSETEDTGSSGNVIVEMFEDSPEDAAEALMLEYMIKYANEYSKELLFAIDLMTLVRYLNKFDLRYIVYITSGNAPTSPCDDTLDQALRIIWESMTKRHKFQLELKEKTELNYRRFQDMILHTAKIWEDSKWCDEFSFLIYCLQLAESAVYAEKNGLKNAYEFIPLVICRTIQKRKDSGQFPVDFWETLAEFALQITNGL